MAAIAPGVAADWAGCAAAVGVCCMPTDVAGIAGGVGYVGATGGDVAGAGFAATEAYGLAAMPGFP